jgi:hypothetical protein
MPQNASIRSASVIVVVVTCFISTAFPYSRLTGEEDRFVKRFSRLYGPPIKSQAVSFAVAPDFLLRAMVQPPDTLIGFSLAPMFTSPHPEPKLPKARFENLIAELNSIKALGNLEEDPGGADRSGWRSTTSKRFHYAYVTVSEWPDHSIASASIFYIRPLQGVFTFPRGSTPEGTSSFAIICLNGFPYWSPRLDAATIRKKQYQAVSVAGPVGERMPACEQ